MDDDLHFGMPWGSRDYEDEGGESDKQDAIPTTRQRQCVVTVLKRFDLGTSDVDVHEGDHGNDLNTNADEESSQADDVSTHNVEDSGQSTRDCEDSTVYFRPVKSDNGEANAMASNDSEAKTVL